MYFITFEPDFSFSHYSLVCVLDRDSWLATNSVLWRDRK